MGATAVQFPTPTLVSGSLRTLSAASSAAASNTKISVPALTVTAVVRRFTPEVTQAATTAGVPNGAFDNIGWQMDTDIVPLSDAGVTRASAITVRCALIANQATPTTITVGLYVSGVFLASQFAAASTSVSTAQANVDLVVNVPAGITIPVGGRLQLAVSASCTNLSATTASLVTLLYTATGSTVGALTYTINSVRNGTETPTATATVSRVASSIRTASESTGSTDVASRVSSDFRRAGSESETEADTASRSAAHMGYTHESTAQTDSTRRVVTSSRNGSQSESTIDTAFRAITKSLNITDVAPTGTQTASKTLTFGRGTREYFQPTDPPITVPTKRIAGTVYVRADGSRYLGGATVTLVRDDGLECGTTTSSLTDGTYSFVRDAFDTYTYSTRIKAANVGGVTEEAVSQSGLVPA